jgi:RimJ/RimL family protein N-acetyltransferase
MADKITQHAHNIVFRKGKIAVLRPLSLEDAPLLAQWMNDEETTRWLLRQMPLSVEAEEVWLKETVCTAIASNATDITLGIASHDGQLLGVTGLHSISWIHGTATTGTVIGRKADRGQGYATDAKMLLLGFAFLRLNLRKICSTVIAPNGASLRYAQKCGYKEEGRQVKQIYVDGEYHDLVHLGVFKEDWLPLWEAHNA